jgi:hypothetical protein
VVLRQKGDHWYGDGPTDVWEYFVLHTRENEEPVNHWKQVVCECGHAVFEVDRDDEEGCFLRRCVNCGSEHEFLAGAYPDAEGFVTAPGEEELAEVRERDSYLTQCICEGGQFEVVGVTAPFCGFPDSARWFYLGLRCVGCGCLGCYGDKMPRYNDRALLLRLL